MSQTELKRHPAGEIPIVPIKDKGAPALVPAE
jgi:hypothetical protein